jgi:uncharacterized protein YjcR
MMNYKQFQESENLLFHNKKVIYNYNDKNYFLFSKTMNIEHNKENLFNCYEWIKENKKELLNNSKIIKIDNFNYYLSKIDTTHFYISNDNNFKGVAHHLNQHKTEIYYNDLKKWLKM